MAEVVVMVGAGVAALIMFVFIASTLIHVVIKWHNPDYKKLPNEDEVRAAIRKGSPAPAQYIIPHCMEGKDRNSPETTRKFEEKVATRPKKQRTPATACPRGPVKFLAR